MAYKVMVVVVVVLRVQLVQGTCINSVSDRDIDSSMPFAVTVVVVVVVRNICW